MGLFIAVQAHTLVAAQATVAASAVLQSAETYGKSPPSVSVPALAASAMPPVVLRWQAAARSSERLTAKQLGLVINLSDPYSVAVGDYYARRRGLNESQILRTRLPVRGRLSIGEFDGLKAAIDARFGPSIQALALAWVLPFAVDCQSITGVLALGFDPQLCSRTCERGTKSPYYNASTGRPFTAFGWRPSMLLAAPGVASARALIDRGVASDSTLGLRGGLPVHAHFMVTRDGPRNVRARDFPPPGFLRSKQVQIHVDAGEVPEAISAQTAARAEGPSGAASSPGAVLLVETGLARLPPLRTSGWVPGAVADHLTSFGGVLDQDTGQTDVLAWIGSGATASYGTVSEPCNHPQKFPHPQMLLLHYLQGVTVLEAYWKSVAWPRQGVFVGEPLAAPFAPRRVAP